MASQLRSEVRSIQSLNSEIKKRMYVVFEGYYRDVTEELFFTDLKEKDHVILLWAKSPRKLIGFSTISVKPGLHDEVTIFSGDTVIERAYWGSQVLQKSFARFLASTKFKNPSKTVYWMLISKSFKTYLLMRRNFPISYPNHTALSAHTMQLVKDDFYSRKFGQFYNEEKSLIHFDTPHGAVKGEIAKPSDGSILQNQDIAFFVHQNPGYVDGDELACIAKIRLRDILYVLVKYVFEKKRKGTRR